MLLLMVLVQSWLVCARSSSRAARRQFQGDVPASALGEHRARARGDGGQTTAEYALVLIGAAALALLFITWATKTDRIGKLFDLVMEQITGRAK